MLHLATPRLVLADVREDDLDALLAVALSNPSFTGHAEGSDGVPGLFDLGMLERDLAVAALDPARHPLTVRRRSDDRVVGWADVLEDHPRDGVPWIGLLELHADVQRRGYGREAAGALAQWARDRGAPALRLGVDDGNDAALAFWSSLGYVEVDRRERRGPAGPLAVAVLELAL